MEREMVAMWIVWNGFVWYCIGREAGYWGLVACHAFRLARINRRIRRIEAETRAIERSTIAATLQTAELRWELKEGRR